MERLTLSVLALAAAPAAAQSYGIHAVTEAEYTTLPFLHRECHTATGTFCTSEAAHMLPQQGESYAFGGYQEIFLGAQVRGVARAWGWGGPPGPLHEVAARSSASAEVTWRSDSGTIPRGTPIRVRLVMPFTGRLGLNSPLPGSLARVLANVVVQDRALPPFDLYRAEGVLGPGGLTVTGAWEGDFTPASVLIPGFGISGGYELDTLDVVSFDTTMAEAFLLSFALVTRAYLPGPFEVGAIADFGNTGQYTLEAVDPATNQPLPVTFESVACRADCDVSTGPLVLDIFDFLCFQNLYDAGDPYACECDTGTGIGVCDIFDFLCFQNAFAAGCP